MNVPTLDWCVKHGHPRYYTENFCWWGRPPCDIVTRRLVPVDALVLTRGEDGNWPIPKRFTAQVRWPSAKASYLGEHEVQAVLDALEAAGKKEQ